MLGDNPLGVLRVHLPGLAHRWHEITPWKCNVWVWGGAPSRSSNIDAGNPDCGMPDMEEPPPQTAADALGA